MQLRAYTKEFKTNLMLAYPIMLGQLGHIMVAFADNIMVGRLGAAPLAAVSLGNSLVFIALSLGIGFSFAITPLIAEADGSAATKMGRNYFHHGIVLCAINGVVLFYFYCLPNLFCIIWINRPRWSCWRSLIWRSLHFH